MVKNETLQTRQSDAILDIRQQKQVLKFIAAITLIFFVPLGIKNLLIGETMLGAVLDFIGALGWGRPWLDDCAGPIFLRVDGVSNQTL